MPSVRPCVPSSHLIFSPLHHSIHHLQFILTSALLSSHTSTPHPHQPPHTLNILAITSKPNPTPPPHPISPLSLKYNPLICPFTPCSALQPSLLSLLSLHPSLFLFYPLFLCCQSTLLLLYCMSIIIATLIKFIIN